MRTIDEYFTRVRQLVQSIADIHAERYEVCSESLSRQIFRILGQSQFNGIIDLSEIERSVAAALSRRARWISGSK
jgi:hypothetical protein